MVVKEERLELSRLIKLTIYALSYRPLTALNIAAVTIYLPYLIGERFLPAPQEVYSIEFAYWWLKSMPLHSVTAIFQAWITLQALDGNASTGALRTTLSRLSTLYFTSLFIAALGLVGFYALVIPGIIWGLACAVAIPAAAAERIGIRKAIKRSFELTKGRRLTLLGYWLVIALPVQLAFTLVDLAVVGGRLDLIDTSPLRVLFSTLTMMLVSANSTAAYIELVRIDQATRTVTSTPQT